MQKTTVQKIRNACIIALILCIFVTYRAYIQRYLSSSEYNLRRKVAWYNCEKAKYGNSRVGFKRIPGYESYPCKRPLYRNNCSSCAYVTGSGHMIGSKLGKEIDDYDCVFRSNSAPIGEWSEDVGTKTTFRTIDHSSVHAMKQLIDDHGLQYFDINAPNSTIFLGYHLTFHDEKSEVFYIMPEWPEITFYTISEVRFEKLLDLYHKEIGPTNALVWMSNGFITLQIMSDFCPSINVYGIAPPDHCEKVQQEVPGYEDVPYHYYTGNWGHAELECWKFWRHSNGYWGHRFLKEKELFKSWAMTRNDIHFHQPEWNL